MASRSKLNRHVPHFVVIGGGTGTAVVLTGLKQYPAHLSAIVSVADSGGSTGRLRDEFGFLPVGDLRQALSALANTNDDQHWIRDLLLYRFTKGSGLEGHNLGNLILTALQDMTGSTAQAVALAGSIFRLEGQIFPSTLHQVDLVIEYTDGTFLIGEHHLNPQQTGGKTIKSVRLSPRAAVYRPAVQALKAADLIVIGPGDMYASLIPNLIVRGMRTAIKHVQAPVVFVLNLMTSYTQTHGLTASDHLRIIEKELGRSVDYVIVNSQPIPSRLLSVYAAQHEFPVIDDLGHTAQIIRARLLQSTQVKPQPGDTLARSYLRHSPPALAKVLHALMKT